MLATLNQQRSPFGLVVTGEANNWRPALERIVGTRWLATYTVGSDRELLSVVESGVVDAAVLDDDAHRRPSVLHVMRSIRRLNASLPVVVVSERRDRRWLEDALQLAVFSVVAKPLELEEFLRQIRRMMMIRADRSLRGETGCQ